MKPTLLLVLLAGTLAGCSSSEANPFSPDPIGMTEVAAASTGAARGSDDAEDIRDALDRVAATIDGAAAGRLRAALHRLLVDISSDTRADVAAAIELADAVEREQPTAGPEVDAIRLALRARQ